MAVDLGLPVPPAFTITTAACNEYLADRLPAGLDDELREHMARMAQLVGQEFGAPANASWSASGPAPRSPCPG